MVLIAAVLVPLLAGGFLLTIRPQDGSLDRVVAASAAGLTAMLVVLAAWIRPEFDARWIPALDLRWHLGIDGLSVGLVLLTGLIGVMVVAHTLAGPDPVGGSRATFLGCLLLVEGGALGTFLARDALLFFIAFEVVLIPMWVLISRFGDPHASADVRREASQRFVFFTVTGSTLMLIGLLVLITRAGTGDLSALATRHGAGLTPTEQTVVAILLVLGLSIKLPLWPLHTWLPAAHTVAPTAGSVLLAAILLKMGSYGLIRVALLTVPEGFARIAPLLAILGGIGIIWGGLICLVERDLKRLVAYSSVAHMGFVALALASGSALGVQAAIVVSIAHGLVSALLFFVVGDLKEDLGTADLHRIAPSLRAVAPRRGYALLVGLAASLGLPPLVSFWGEFTALYAAINPVAGVARGALWLAAVLGVVGLSLAAAYSLRVARLVWAGPAAAASHEAPALSDAPVVPDATVLPDVPAISDVAALRDVTGVRWAVDMLLVTLIIGLGLLPQLLFGPIGVWR